MLRVSTLTFEVFHFFPCVCYRDHDEDSSVGQLIKKNAGDVSNLKGMGRYVNVIVFSNRFGS